MNHTLGLLPSGKIRCFTSEQTEAEKLVSPVITELFLKQNIAEGLLALATLPNGSFLPATFHFWFELANHYMTIRCYASRIAPGEVLMPIDPIDRIKAESLISGSPPMQGTEYLTVEVLQNHWRELDDQLCLTVNKNFEGLADFLNAHAPHWHQAGRVCFHLAENKNDADYPFAFMATYSASYNGIKSQHLPLIKAMQEYSGADNRTKLIHLLSPIDLASKSSSLIKSLVESGDIYHPLAWRAEQAYNFLKEVPLFEQSGVVIRLPDWWKKRPRPQVGATLGSNLQQTLDANSMLQFDVHVALGEQKLSKREWSSLLASNEGLVLLKGQWVEVNKEKLEQAMSQMQALEARANSGELSFAEGMRLLAGASSDLSDTGGNRDSEDWAFIQADKKLSSLLKNIRQPEKLRSALPKNLLKATLRPYQQTGVNWLWYLNQLGLGACLADDMGLGKTIQIISLLLILKKNKAKPPSLLVLPTSLMGNWKNELIKFAPSLKITFVHPSMISKIQLKALSEKNALADTDLVITTYGMLLRQSWLQAVDWQLVVLDEAQAIKNPGAQQTKAVKTLRALSRIVLTGTPVENRLSDLWSLFDFINPGLLGSAARFKSFVKSLEKRPNEQYAPLRNLVQPYILRRMKTDKTIISDLPDKTEVYAYCGLAKEQAALYQKSVDELKSALQNEEGMKRRGLILAFLTRFKQICNHPAQHLSDGDYSQHKSGKFARLAEICEAVNARQEKVLLFTQYREMCQPIADFLAERFGRKGFVLHGGVPAKKRQQMVEQFQTDDGPPFFVLSIKAGGTGLTLTQASHVIHFDRWWNPAVENQATDRSFRIGQKSNVLVHKFVCLGTIEEKIDAIISEKAAMADELLEGKSEIKLTEMNDRELLDLVSLDIDRAVM